MPLAIDRRPPSLAWAAAAGFAVSALALGWILGGANREAPAVDSVHSISSPTVSRSVDETGTIATANTSPPTIDPKSAIRGHAEVVDTTTLRVNGVLIRLAGVEWARGGRASDLSTYLQGRDVSCTKMSEGAEYRCLVGNQDLSRVVLYNGGARAKYGVSPELLDAERQAKQAHRGVWASAND